MSGGGGVDITISHQEYWLDILHIACNVVFAVCRESGHTKIAVLIKARFLISCTNIISRIQQNSDICMHLRLENTKTISHSSYMPNKYYTLTRYIIP